MPLARSSTASREMSSIPPEALFAMGAVSQYLGAAVAVAMFDRMDAAGVAGLRLTGAAILFVLIRRTWRLRLSRRQVVLAALFGVVTAAMNLCFYLAIDELHLGTTVALEFLGPITVAALGTRSLRNAASLGLALSGVILLAEVRTEGSTIGVVFALLAGLLWAGYIVLGHRVARSGSNAVEALGIGMAAGALALLPISLWTLGPVLDSPWLLLVGLATGLLSNVIPYGLDQVVLQGITRARFALLQALLPVVAALIGLVALAQVPSWWEALGIVLVVGALALRTRDTVGTVAPSAPTGS